MSPGHPPGERSSSLTLVWSWSLAAEGQYSAETPPIQSPAAFDHQPGGLGDTCNDAVVLAVVVLYVGAAVFSPFVLFCRLVTLRCERLIRMSITPDKPCRCQTPVSHCECVSWFEMVILKCPVFWVRDLLAGLALCSPFILAESEDSLRLAELIPCGDRRLVRRCLQCRTKAHSAVPEGWLLEWGK